MAGKKLELQLPDELFAQLEERQIEDPKLVIGAYWLHGHVNRMTGLGK